MDLDLNVQRAKLEAMQRDLQESITTMTTGDEAVSASDPQHEGDVSGNAADDADQVFEAERQQALIQNSRNDLELVESALARLDRGIYGLCQECGKPIDPRRLEAQPQAMYDLEHQAMHEVGEEPGKNI